MSNPIWTGWTDTHVETVRTLTSRGLSASQIAARLGCSRNAVIGKRHREGIKSLIPAWDPRTGNGPPVPYKHPTRSESAKTQSAVRRLFKPNDVRPPKVRETKIAANQSWPAKILADLSNSGECRMPRQSSKPAPGHCDETLYCAAEIEIGETYCDDCRKIMFQRPRSKAEQAEINRRAALARAGKAMKPRAAA